MSTVVLPIGDARFAEVVEALKTIANWFHVTSTKHKLTAIFNRRLGTPVVGYSIYDTGWQLRLEYEVETAIWSAWVQYGWLSQGHTFYPAGAYADVKISPEQKDLLLPSLAETIVAIRRAVPEVGAILDAAA